MVESFQKSYSHLYNNSVHQTRVCADSSGRMGDKLTTSSVEPGATSGCDEIQNISFMSS